MEDFDYNANYYKVFLNCEHLKDENIMRKSFEPNKGFYHELNIIEKKEVIHKGPFNLFKVTKIKKDYFPIIVKQEGNLIRDILTNEIYEEMDSSCDDHLKVYLVVQMSFDEVCEEIERLSNYDIDRYIKVMEEIIKNDKKNNSNTRRLVV